MYIPKKYKLFVNTEVNTLCLSDLSSACLSNDSLVYHFFADGSYQSIENNGWAFNLYVGNIYFGQVGGNIRANDYRVLDSNFTELVAVGEILRRIVEDNRLRAVFENKYNPKRIVIHTDNKNVINEINGEEKCYKYKQMTNLYLKYKRKISCKIKLKFTPSQTNERHNEVHNLAQQMMRNQ